MRVLRVLAWVLGYVLMRAGALLSRASSACVRFGKGPALLVLLLSSAGVYASTVVEGNQLPQPVFLAQPNNHNHSTATYHHSWGAFADPSNVYGGSGAIANLVSGFTASFAFNFGTSGSPHYGQVMWMYYAVPNSTYNSGGIGGKTSFSYFRAEWIRYEQSSYATANGFTQAQYDSGAWMYTGTSSISSATFFGAMGTSGGLTNLSYDPSVTVDGGINSKAVHDWLTNLNNNAVDANYRDVMDAYIAIKAIGTATLAAKWALNGSYTPSYDSSGNPVLSAGNTSIDSIMFGRLWKYIASHGVDPKTFVPNVANSDGTPWWENPAVLMQNDWNWDGYPNFLQLGDANRADPTPSWWYNSGISPPTSYHIDTGSWGSVGGTTYGDNTSSEPDNGYAIYPPDAVTYGPNAGDGPNGTGSGGGGGTGAGGGSGGGTGGGGSGGSGSGSGTGTGDYDGPTADQFPSSSLPSGAGTATSQETDTPGSASGGFSGLVGSWASFSPTAQTNESITFTIPIPGNGNQTYTINSLPDTGTTWGSALNTLRILLRTFFAILLVYAFVKRVYQDVVEF